MVNRLSHILDNGDGTVTLRLGHPEEWYECVIVQVAFRTGRVVKCNQQTAGMLDTALDQKMDPMQAATFLIEELGFKEI